ncbi:MAG: baseplate J/gp47 family protein [Rhodocyclaceae bacterium]|nr:baseplate J/gp47 family protein [Rhodocyclaceae bacterium]
MPADIRPAFSKKDFSTLVADLLAHARDASGGRTPLTDSSEGSVVRTLMEAFARELAQCYEQMDVVWRYAYLDSADGAALDNVVALLGLTRRRAGHLEGAVQFTRAQPAPEDIHIPAGTLLSGRDAPLAATTEHAVLAKGERIVAAPVRAVEAGGDPVPAGRLNVMPRPLAGIDGVTNPADLILRQREETDAELRERTRRALRAAATGTVDALAEAVRSFGLKEVQVLENPDGAAGRVKVLIGDTDLPDDLLEQVRNRVDEVRPAGILVSTGPAARVWVQVTATLELNADLPDEQRKAIETELSAAVAAYFDALKVGEAARAAKLRSILAAHAAVVAVHDTPGYRLMKPFAYQDGAMQDAEYKYLRASGDLIVAPDERLGLYVQLLPTRISMEPPKLNLWADLRITVSAGYDAEPLRPALLSAINGVFDAAQKAVDGGQQAAIAYDALAAAVAGVLKNKLVKFAATLVHERDGRAQELQAAGAAEPLGSREQVLVRNFVLRAETA